MFNTVGIFETILILTYIVEYTVIVKYPLIEDSTSRSENQKKFAAIRV